MQEEHNILQQAITELQKTPTINIKDKVYNHQLSTKLNIFRKYFPLATLETSIIQNDENKVITQSKIKIDSVVIATGYAEETKRDENRINSISALERCEMSSIIRVLFLYGLGEESEYILPVEVKNKISQQNTFQPIEQQEQPQNNTEQSYDTLSSIGLSVTTQGENLIIMGNDIYSKKDTIKSYGFKWNINAKHWYKPLEEQLN
jgi:hypothetical protein